MERREPRGRIFRAAVVALAVAVLPAFSVAAVLAGWRNRAEGWTQSGYSRVLFDVFWSNFDLGLAIAAGVVALAIALAAWRAGPARRIPRVPGIAVGFAALVLLPVGALRLVKVVDDLRPRPGPNVLLISIDPLRADRLGTYGHDRPTSPGLDRRLAAPGAVFEYAYSQSPKTTPSHMTMLTSLQPCVHGIKMWMGQERGDVLSPAVNTLAEVLRGAGYRTAAFTGGGHVHYTRGFDHGFERFQHHRQVDRAIDWMEGHENQPWFIFFHTYEIHDPYVPPGDLIEMFDPDYDGPIRETVEKVRAGVGGWDRAHAVFWESVDRKNPREVEFVERLYDAGIRKMDDQTLSRLLDALDRLDPSRDTLVLLTSDHGEAFGEHGNFMHQDLYSETTRVPMIIRFPGRVPAGARIREQVAVIDVMPTILDLIGVPPPPYLQGRSLAPLLAAGPAGGETPAALGEFENMLAYRSPELTYLAEGDREMLFDRRVDPGETRDLAGERLADLGALRDDVARWRDECTRLAARFGPGGGPGVVPDDETMDRLRSLGYVE